MSLQTVESKDYCLGDLFASFYVVPSFQREYIWGSDEVRQLLEDVNSEFASAERNIDSEYFIGTIVTCAVGEDNVFQLIDGQQRMTTAYLVLCAIRDYLEKLGAKEIVTLKSQISSTSVNKRGEDVFRYRVDLQYEDSSGVLEDIANGDPLPNGKGGNRSVRNIVNAYEVILSFLEEQFKNDKDVRRFYAYFTQNVKLIRVKTISITHALKIFETINDRGVGLDSMDLLKNLIFMQASMKDFDKLKKQWKELVDVLDRAREKPLRFLRYYIFGSYNVDRLREEEIYDWFNKNEVLCEYKSKPFDFVAELIQAAKCYTNFVKGKDAEGEDNRYLANIRAMSGAARQHLILLLAGRQLESELFTELCREIENLFFAYVITHENTREFERKFAQWTKDLRKVKTKQQLGEFLRTFVAPEKSNLAARFALAMQDLRENSLQKYRLKYVLGKLTQHINERAFGEETQGNLDDFIDGSIHIEHVLPQRPSTEALAEFDKPQECDDYVGRLGNLVLAEEVINISLGNQPFSKKRSTYKHSEFLLTQLLSGKVEIGKNNKATKALEGLPIPENWTSKDIEDRQIALADLAGRVWEMPKARATATLGK